ncbi:MULTISPECIES: 5'-nucleotidase C-terminal domain-containing protein [Bacteria]|uniref:2',3'-cyclic-nucleotide 2'-phosphodiesterase / 3'-nucleotidase n=1 Tax=Geotoga petraea TaxID=28234 RepID=A0A1G6HR69_9BACT|nr:MULTISPECIES: 5'-nucleotidase C-terminal domain-containing protein [Bacteria]SDB96787.1 2',3'-cyclic-nucleotide 2'-phosphodiesterase / 3'-nucleotidase [Geotoga petraea]
MKNFRFLMVFTFVLISVFAIAQVHIAVIGTSDTHGALTSYSYTDMTDYENVGFERIASIVEEVKNNNENVIVLDNGDTIQGSLLTDDLYNTQLFDQPHPLIQAMNKIGYDALTLGNHEFNFGLELIEKMKKEAEFPLLSANIYYKKDGSNFQKPYLIKEFNGVKVGIIGLTTPNIPRWDGPKVEDLTFNDMKTEAEKYVKELKNEHNVDVIIAMTHAGLEARHENEGSAAKRVAEIPEIDVLITGHDHVPVNETIGNTLVTAPRAKYGQADQVVKIDLTLEQDGENWKVINKKAENISIADYEPSKNLSEITEKAHQETMSFLKDPIGTATADFHPDYEVPGIPAGRVQDTAVVDLINIIQLHYTGADISAAALFKASSNIKKGEVSYADIFDIYKYPNTLYAVNITGKELKEYMEWSVSYYNQYKPGDLTISFDKDIPAYNLDLFQGVEYKVDISEPKGQRIKNLTYKGKPVKDDQVFELALNNYRYGGLKSMGMLSHDAHFQSDPKSIRLYIREFIEEKGTIEPKVDYNWEIIGVDFDHPLRDDIIEMIKNDKLELPSTEDARISNIESINLHELIKNNKLSKDVLTENNLKLYEVKDGDTLYQIGLDYNLMWDKLAELNEMANPNNIEVGRKVLVPAEVN